VQPDNKIIYAQSWGHLKHTYTVMALMQSKYLVSSKMQEVY